MANAVFNSFKLGLLQGSFNLAASPTVYFVLVGSGYTADIDSHLYRSSVTDEIAGSNYNQGGYALSGPTLRQDDTNNQGILDGTDILLANITFDTSPRACVLYGSSGLGVDSDPLIAYIDFGSDQAVTAGTFQITWAAGGIIALT